MGPPTRNAWATPSPTGAYRLTNWDVARVASLVRPGTQVVFK